MVIYKTRAISLIRKLIALNYHRRILFTEIFSHTRRIWKSALPICNYSQVIYQFLMFTHNLKRSPDIAYCFHLTRSSYTQSITEICFSTAGHSCYDKVLSFINPISFRQLQDGSSIQLSCLIVYRFIDIGRWIAESCFSFCV